MKQGDLRLRTVVLVEPICRGSRLQILANVLSALRDRVNVILVTRSDYQSDHFNELIASVGLLPRVVTADTDLGGAWMKNLSFNEFDAFSQVLCKLEGELAQEGGYDLVFMALDDYLAAFSTHAMLMKLRLRNARVTCIKYRVEYLFLLTKNDRFRGVVLRLLTRWSLFAIKAKLLTFDERLGVLKPNYLAGVLPDPWFGPFSPEYREQGRSLLGVSPGDFVVLTLGKQDRRKGFDFLIEAFPKVASDKRVKMVVVGTIAAPFSAAFLALKKRFPSQIVHVDDFVPEADLPRYFSASDAFLLPYSEDFTATSGTLARAAASGVAALATSHGLVGYRVRENRIGETFEARNYASFKWALDVLASLTSNERQDLRRRSIEFSESCALPRFEMAFRAALNI